MSVKRINNVRLLGNMHRHRAKRMRRIQSQREGMPVHVTDQLEPFCKAHAQATSEPAALFCTTLAPLMVPGVQDTHGYPVRNKGPRIPTINQHPNQPFKSNVQIECPNRTSKSNIQIEHQTSKFNTQIQHRTSNIQHLEDFVVFAMLVWQCCVCYNVCIICVVTRLCAQVEMRSQGSKVAVSRRRVRQGRQ
jgi:hypothetical protein